MGLLAYALYLLIAAAIVHPVISVGERKGTGLIHHKPVAHPDVDEPKNDNSGEVSRRKGTGLVHHKPVAHPEHDSPSGENDTPADRAEASQRKGPGLVHHKPVAHPEIDESKDTETAQPSQRKGTGLIYEKPVAHPEIDEPNSKEAGAPAQRKGTALIHHKPLVHPDDHQSGDAEIPSQRKGAGLVHTLPVVHPDDDIPILKFPVKSAPSAEPVETPIPEGAKEPSESSVQSAVSLNGSVRHPVDMPARAKGKRSIDISHAASSHAGGTAVGNQGFMTGPQNLPKWEV